MPLRSRSFLKRRRARPIGSRSWTRIFNGMQTSFWASFPDILGKDNTGDLAGWREFGAKCRFATRPAAWRTSSEDSLLGRAQRRTVISSTKGTRREGQCSRPARRRVGSPKPLPPAYGNAVGPRPSGGPSSQEGTMADDKPPRKKRKKKPRPEARTSTNVPEHLLAKARMVAASKGLDLKDYLESVIRP